MSTYLLVHGAWHGAWSWYKIIPRLERAGHRVIAPDLPGLGRDTTPLREISLASWVDFLCAQLDREREPVILVGHSRAGIVISQTAEHRPDRIRTLVYVTAILPRHGESMSRLVAGVESLITPNSIVSDDRLSCSIREEVLRDGFYACCSDEDVTLARKLLRPEPVAPMITPVTLTDQNFGRVPRVYVECLQDRAIALSLQRQMHTATPCQRVASINTDHSPFLSRPDELAEILLSI
ncbi:MAG TPA: alpha/beta fold hydrolase [Steroidobacteraceae bacterium]